MQQQLITNKEAAELFRVTTKTINAWVNEGKLSRVKFGSSLSSRSRIEMSSVQKLIEQNRTTNAV